MPYREISGRKFAGSIMPIAFSRYPSTTGHIKRPKRSLKQRHPAWVPGLIMGPILEAPFGDEPPL
jgi:hypothetical protein